MDTNKTKPKSQKKTTKPVVEKVTEKQYTAREYCGMKGLDSFDTAFVNKMFSSQSKTEVEWEKALKSKINLR